MYIVAREGVSCYRSTGPGNSCATCSICALGVESFSSPPHHVLTMGYPTQLFSPNRHRCPGFSFVCGQVELISSGALAGAQKNSRFRHLSSEESHLTARLMETMFACPTYPTKRPGGRRQAGLRRCGSRIGCPKPRSAGAYHPPHLRTRRVQDSGSPKAFVQNPAPHRPHPHLTR